MGRVSRGRGALKRRPRRSSAGVGGLPPAARPRALLARATHGAPSSPRASGAGCRRAQRSQRPPRFLPTWSCPGPGCPPSSRSRPLTNSPRPARASPVVHTRRNCHPRLFQAQGTGDRGLSEPPAPSDTDRRQMGTIALWSSGCGKPGALTSVVPGRRRDGPP